jgi:RNA polymerase sigma factor (sigma-70 family)
VNTSDQELIKKLISTLPAERGEGWTYLYKTYYPIIKDMILKLNGSADDATDIFQDGLVILNRNLNNGTFKGESSLSTYIYSICKNLWLKEYNRRTKEAMLEPELVIEMRQNFHYLINIEIVSVLMNELGEDCKRILVEYYYNERSMAELKDMFNVNSIQAAKNKKWRCLKYLEKLFKERALTPTWE